jgi:hypothetical protein
MGMKGLLRIALIVLVGSTHLALVCAHHHALAQVMQSSSYRIESDSLNFGGNRSTSSSYALEDTAGEIATGYSSSSSYVLGAGYQQTLENYLSLSLIEDVVMSPTLGGLTGGTSNGSTTAVVLTDNAAGYQLTIKATATPAMRSGTGDTILDYAPSGADPDYAFNVPAAVGQFGFSPEGIDISARYRDNGSICNSGSSDTSLACWDGLSSTEREIAHRTSSNHPNGSTTTLRFRVGIGANAAIPEGTYFATTTVTALPL